MEVKPGYKQTEVGVIPEEWEAVPLKGKVGIAHGFAFASEHFASHGPYRLATPGHFNEAGGFRDIGQKQKYYVGPVPTDYVLQPGDVIVAMTEQADGLLGSAAVIPDEQGYLHNQRLGRVRVLSSELQLDYLVYVFNSPSYRTKVRETAAGTKVKHTSPEKLLEISVRLPPVPEQRAIAEALSDVDGLLGGLDRLIAKKRDLKQAAMQQLVTGQTRLPRFHGEWEVKRLDTIAEIRSGGTPSTGEPRFWDGDIPWCTPTDITALDRHKYLGETARMITQLGLKASSAEMIPARSVVMTSRATIGECAINAVPVSTNQGFKNFVPFATTDVDFLYYLLGTQKQGFISLCGGSTFLEIGKTQLAAYRVQLPSAKTEQTAIAEVLSDMDAELAALEQRLKKTRDLKHAMMQELLTGRTRLLVPDRNVIPLQKAERAGSSNLHHNWQINEAVVIAVLTKHFGSEQYPLGRKRYTKLSYLLHRHVEKQVKGYLKKAAGPYNPGTKYKGPEGIALKRNYVCRHSRDKFTGFVSSDNITEAEKYFARWYGNDVLTWLEKFRRKTNDDLELLATVDMATEDLRSRSRSVDLKAVREVIGANPEWEAKLSRPTFSDINIKRAINICRNLFAT